jgi:hypothetical protein
VVAHLRPQVSLVKQLTLVLTFPDSVDEPVSHVADNGNSESESVIAVAAARAEDSDH